MTYQPADPDTQSTNLTNEDNAMTATQTNEYNTVTTNRVNEDGTITIVHSTRRPRLKDRWTDCAVMVLMLMSEDFNEDEPAFIAGEFTKPDLSEADRLLISKVVVDSDFHALYLELWDEADDSLAAGDTFEEFIETQGDKASVLYQDDNIVSAYVRLARSTFAMVQVEREAVGLSSPGESNTGESDT